MEVQYYLGILGDSVEHASEWFCLGAKETGMFIYQFL